MTPKSQFISAYGTMAVLLTKAAVSVILQKNDFMFLRCHYEYCLDQLDTSFAKLAATDPSCIFYSDFRRALQEMGVSDSHIFAGFNALDIQQSGRVSLQNFRCCLKDVFTASPDASHVSLLAQFCQEAFCNVSGYASLDSMLGLVLSQWRKIRMNEFGQLLYHYLMQDPGVERLFRSASFRTQSLLFASFVQVGLGWLEEKDFRRVERDMTSLGMRHVGYGVHPSHLCVFQLALPLGFKTSPESPRLHTVPTRALHQTTRCSVAVSACAFCFEVEGAVQPAQGPAARSGDGLVGGLASLYRHPLHTGAPDHGGDREEGRHWDGPGLAAAGNQPQELPAQLGSKLEQRAGRRAQLEQLRLQGCSSRVEPHGDLGLLHSRHCRRSDFTS